MRAAWAHTSSGMPSSAVPMPCRLASPAGLQQALSSVTQLKLQRIGIGISGGCELHEVLEEVVSCTQLRHLECEAPVSHISSLAGTHYPLY